MADFLVLLAKINLAMAGAILIVALLRRPMRAAFHAPVAYALWLLVPAAVLASLLPPRVVTVAALPANMPIPAALHTEPLRLGAVAVQAAPFDWILLFFVCWLTGMGAMALFMAWQQRQFHTAERQGAAGPAVTGFLKPRIVIPSGFAAQFSASEQAAILAHEQAHLARQDARVNAMVALLRCLCWFNPLVHLGALWLRKDQELACDASAMTRVSRIDYANALLKSQMRAMALPLGCAWPGSEHPLTERVALLRRQIPGRTRTVVGIGAILSLALLAGVSAWAAEPPQTAPGSVANAVINVTNDGPVKPVASTGKRNFTGMMFYAQRDGKSGQPLFLTLESAPKDASGKPWLGHEVLHFPYGVAWSDSARYSAEKTITLSGNVTLVSGSSGLEGLHGNTLVFDYPTGMLDLDGKQMPSGMPKYVPCTKDCKKRRF